MIIFETAHIPIKLRSEALGKRLSSSNNANIPIGLDNSISNTGLLSENSTRSTGTPSAMYSCCSQVKIC